MTVTRFFFLKISIHKDQKKKKKKIEREREENTAPERCPQYFGSQKANGQKVKQTRERSVLMGVEAARSKQIQAAEPKKG